jgi:hypothetical protein
MPLGVIYKQAVFRTSESRPYQQNDSIINV